MEAYDLPVEVEGENQVPCLAVAEPAKEPRHPRSKRRLRGLGGGTSSGRHRNLE